MPPLRYTVILAGQVWDVDRKTSLGSGFVQVDLRQAQLNGSYKRMTTVVRKSSIYEIRED